MYIICYRETNKQYILAKKTIKVSDSASVNIKIQNFTYSASVGKYNICSILLLDHQDIAYSESKSDIRKNENNQEELKDCN